MIDFIYIFLCNYSGLLSKLGGFEILWCEYLWVVTFAWEHLEIFPPHFYNLFHTFKIQFAPTLLKYNLFHTFKNTICSTLLQFAPHFYNLLHTFKIQFAPHFYNLLHTFTIYFTLLKYNLLHNFTICSAIFQFACMLPSIIKCAHIHVLINA